MLLPSTKKRSHSLVRSNLSANDQLLNDFYQTSANTNSVFPAINPVAVSTTNYYSSVKANTIFARPKLIQYIEENMIGNDHIFQGPWGPRRSQ
jgi:hypothetical protein